MYNPSSPYTVYCHECWYSDKWDPFSYGQDYDSQKPFFEQLGELMKRVPKVTTYTDDYAKNVNSEYINFAGSKDGVKNCYLLFNSGSCEDVMYSRGVRYCRDSSDGYYGAYHELCYETVNVHKSSGIIFGQNVSGSVDSMFALNLSGCQDCFGCVNLRHKTRHFFNEPLSKNDYEKKVGEIRGSYRRMQDVRQRFEEFSLKFPRRENNNLKAINVSGDFIFDSKNIRASYEVDQAENCKYLFSVKGSDDSYDVIGYGYDSELLLECVAVGYSNRVIGSFSSGSSHHLEYSVGTKASEYCFGCDGLRGAKFSILNKRYSEEEYKRLREQIVKALKDQGAYGLFMPPALAPFAYNEAIGQDVMPLTKEEALSQGFRWEENMQFTRGKETLTPDQISDHINDVSDKITEEILACITCKRNYKIIKPELDFYRRLVLPLPRQCFNCRHLDRIRRRGSFVLYDRTCVRCGKAIKTNFAPDRPEIVYCEACYQSEVV